MRLGDIACGHGRLVTATLAGSAAEEAGISIGDVVISLDGIAPSSLSQDSAQRRLRGPVGSTVDVVVRRISQVWRLPPSHTQPRRVQKRVGQKLCVWLCTPQN
jgi:C-terminal processing protease CtpA/Prc